MLIVSPFAISSVPIIQTEREKLLPHSKMEIVVLFVLGKGHHSFVGINSTYKLTIIPLSLL